MRTRERLPVLRRSEVITGLSALVLGIGIAGCGKSQYEYEPIKLPDTAEFMGTNNRVAVDADGLYDDPRRTGLSFKVHQTDASKVDCGHFKQVRQFAKDIEIFTEREVELLDGNTAQVTCYGTNGTYPIEHFEGFALTDPVPTQDPFQTLIDKASS